MPKADDIVIVEHVSKEFILHHNRVDSLKGHFVGLFHKRNRPSKEHFQALSDVSFSIGPGEAIGLLGRNGSGKSTLLQIIAGILKPTSGSVVTRGRVAPLIELGVGFHPELTGLENIYLNASLYGLRNRDIRQRVQAIIEFSELAHFIDIPVKNYSSGMYMRLGFSIAVHLEPDVMLADEILAVGDTAFQEKCRKRIAEMRRNGMGIVLVSHAEEQVRSLCDSFVRLDGGRVVEAGRLNNPVRTHARGGA
ncbi:MAG: ABC transporter ATP-binding protein [Gammaproteobacteria bacterium]|nr:ABC transporter ATP-binding protein [Gammaproteobacteria bacterium]